MRCEEESPSGPTKLLILFHGNGEDIGSLVAMADHIRLSLKVHVLVPEYPGYGIYRSGGVRPTTELLLDDALCIFNFFSAPR